MSDDGQPVGGISALLAKRQHTHGDFFTTSLIEQGIIDVLLLDLERWRRLPPSARSALIHIATKMARIVSGDEQEPEHWKDIEGYAELVFRRIAERRAWAENAGAGPLPADQAAEEAS